MIVEIFYYRSNDDSCRQDSCGQLCILISDVRAEEQSTVGCHQLLSTGVWLTSIGLRTTFLYFTSEETISEEKPDMSNLYLDIESLDLLGCREGVQSGCDGLVFDREQSYKRQIKHSSIKFVFQLFEHKLNSLVWYLRIIGRYIFQLGWGRIGGHLNPRHTYIY